MKRARSSINSSTSDWFLGGTLTVVIWVTTSLLSLISGMGVLLVGVAGKTTPVPWHKFPRGCVARVRALAFDGIAGVGILERERLLERRPRLDAVPPDLNVRAQPRPERLW